MDDNERLNALLQDNLSSETRPPKSIDDDIPVTAQQQDLDLCQWQVGVNGMFRPAAKTVKLLPPGVYTVTADQFGPYLVRQKLMSDDIVRLPDSANIQVLEVIRRFWASRDRYTKHGLVFKRGVLLWGPPGSGKTITVHLLIQDLVANGGIVVYCTNPNTTAYLIQAIRRIEKARPLILVYEDIDEIISSYGEHTILALLDGEQQTDNIVSLATSNYPERLGARIVNRPSRFDDRIFVGMPSEVARLAYLKHAIGKARVDVAVWAKETEGLSIAHLREMVAAILCLDQAYPEVLSRLRSMNERPRDIDGFIKRRPGFNDGGAKVAR